MTKVAFAHSAAAQSIAGRPVGIDVAVRGLLHSWLRHSPAGERLCCAGSVADFEDFIAHAALEGIGRDQCRPLSPREFAEGGADCLFIPDPAITARAWMRRMSSAQPFSLCGIAHGVTGEAVAAQFGEYVLAPTTDHDALICPSRAVRSAVENIWAGWEAYLEERSGGRVRCPVQLPVIPLGIDCDHFQRLSDKEIGKSYRQLLNLHDDDIVVMFVGRMSFVSKAHPMPLVLAAERVARATGKKLRLVFHGYFHPDSAEADFRALEASMDHSLISTHLIAENDQRFANRMWAAADIFVSLSDNIQESFGLTPIEAMACGLPVIVSDWDGYRDTVRDGIDGFRVPTLAPIPGTGTALAERYHWGDALYGDYLAGTAQSTAVSVPGVENALLRLVENPQLRAEMGASGRRHARTTFDWAAVIPAYWELWRELAARRNHGHAYTPSHPSFPDPFTTFAAYPTHLLRAGTRLVGRMDAKHMRRIFALHMNFYLPDLLLPAEQSLALLLAIERQAGITAAELAVAMNLNLAATLRTIGWLIKLDLCRVAE